MIGSVPIYGQNKDSIKINTLNTDSIKSNKAAPKPGPFSFITKIFKSKEKKTKQTTLTSENNSVGLKKADTAKQTSNKGQTSKQTITKPDTVKKKNTVDVSGYYSVTDPLVSK